MDPQTMGPILLQNLSQRDKQPPLNPRSPRPRKILWTLNLTTLGAYPGMLGDSLNQSGPQMLVN